MSQRLPIDFFKGARTIGIEIVKNWTDALSELHPAQRIYAYWSYMRDRWPHDKGLRRDHLHVSPDLATTSSCAGMS